MTLERYSDKTGPVRKGEELHAARLETYLRQTLGGDGPLSIEQFPQGHSNLTYLLRWGDRQLVLRRPPFGNQVKSAHDMSREFRVLSRLCEVYSPAPRPFLYCEDDSVLGAPFYIMERRQGIVLRRHLPADLQLDAGLVRRLCCALIDNLVVLHGLDYKAAGLGDLGKPDGYVARQVTGWINRYQNAKTDELKTMDRIAPWIVEHMPKESGAAMLHNDYKFDNVMLDPKDLTRIIAVFDWEMATIGDPLMDLGTSLGYWVVKSDPESLQDSAIGPTAMPGSMTREELAARYAERSGRDISNILFYYCFGLYKFAVIIQQIYARYARGFTKDERFATFNERVRVVGEEAVRAIDTQKL
jgi:aminoglycoside phosphotransferase (APT) family kinase protein